MIDLIALRAANERRWDNVRVIHDCTHLAKPLVAAKVRYKGVETRTGVPWFVIAVIHMRESSQSWTRSLAQGDPIDRVSVNVPRGRGPFPSWEAAAIDALVNCHPYLARHKDWSIGGTLLALEKYNGLGYAARSRPSPYLWAGTDQYRSGKYVRDGVYDPNIVDSQPGCAALLIAMMALDPSIKFSGGPPISVPGSTPTPAPRSSNESVADKPSIRNPSIGSIGAFIKSLVAAIFKIG